MTTLASGSQYYDLAGNQTVGYSADRASSYVYQYDHLNRVTDVAKITGGSNPSWSGPVT